MFVVDLECSWKWWNIKTIERIWRSPEGFWWTNKSPRRWTSCSSI